MRRTGFASEHEDFRQSFRSFLEREVKPHYGAWERDGIIPREVYAGAGEHGFLGMAVPEEYGGAGVQDFRFNMVLLEEIQYGGYASFGIGLGLQNDLCLPYILEFGTPEQKRRWLPTMASGTLLA